MWVSEGGILNLTLRLRKLVIEKNFEAFLFTSFLPCGESSIKGRPAYYQHESPVVYFIA